MPEHGDKRPPSPAAPGAANAGAEAAKDAEAWVDLYGDYLYRFALSRIKDPAQAEDLVQETFLAALRGRGRFQKRAAFQTWLTGILKHKIVDHLRKAGREAPRDDVETLVDAAGDDFKDDGSWQVKPAQWRLSPLKVYENKEFLDILYQCLAELPKRIADAFIMREMQGLDTSEICKLLDITATNTLVMLYRARVYLRRCLETNWFETQA